MAVKEKGHRQRGTGSAFRRNDGRYVGIVELKPGPNGKRRRRTVYGTSMKDVQAKLDDLRTQLRERGDLLTDDTTVEKWLTYWLEEIAAPRLKPLTLASYRTAVSQYLTPTVGKHRLSKLSPAHVRGLHTAMADRGLSTTTAGNAHRVLSAALADAVRWNRCPRNVADARIVRPPRPATHDRHGLELAEAMKVLAVAGTHRLGSTWLVALTLGLRQGERLGLRWSHVDLDAGVIDVAWSLQRVARNDDGTPEVRADLQHHVIEDNYVLLQPKTKASKRVVPLPDFVLTALRARLEAVELERPGYTVDHDLVWCRPDGGPVHHRDDWQAWKDLLAAAEVRSATLHEARNTAASVLGEAGVDQETIRRILGHSSVVQSRAYQRVSVDLARKALNATWEQAALPG